MAGDAGNGRRRVANCLAKKVQKKLGFLVVSTEQCAVDSLGLARPRVCAYFVATVSRIPKHTRGNKEPVTVEPIATPVRHLNK